MLFISATENDPPVPEPEKTEAPNRVAIVRNDGGSEVVEDGVGNTGRDYMTS